MRKAGPSSRTLSLLHLAPAIGVVFAGYPNQ